MVLQPQAVLARTVRTTWIRQSKTGTPLIIDQKGKSTVYPSPIREYLILHHRLSPIINLA